MPDIPLPKPAAPSVPPTNIPPIGTPINGPLPGEPPREISVSPLPTPQTLGVNQPTALVAPVATQQPVVQQPAVMPPAAVGALPSLSSNSLPPNHTAGQAPPPVGAPVAGVPAGAPPAGSPVGAAVGKQVDPKKAGPQFAKPINPLLKILPLVLGGLLLLGLGLFLASRFFGGSPAAPGTPVGNQTGGRPGDTSGGGTGAPTAPTGQAVTLEYWGLWEPAEVMEAVFKDFETQNPGVQVRYTKQSHRDYRERLQTAIASGNGPDLFRFHASWSTMLKGELAAMPSSVYSSSEFQSTFYPAAYKQLQVDGQIVGIPLMYDGLALYYNTKMFETAGVEVPSTWVELRNAAKKLTLTTGSTIERGGVALGSAKNVEHFSDVVAFLMLQNGADLRKPNSPEARDAIAFYTNFLRTDRVWSETLPNSTVAFAREDVAMMFAPSWRVHEILAMNPELEFAIAPLPKLASEQIAWANFWAEGVNNKNSNKDIAWKLLKYLSSKEVQMKLHSEQSKIRPFGELYSRVDLADELATSKYAAPFLQEAPYAQGWFLSSNTFDKGVNDQMIKYYEDAVNASAQGKSMEQVLQTLELGTTQVLRQYNATGMQ
jgi:multiple sugar transport system substrate-binding protein